MASALSVAVTRPHTGLPRTQDAGVAARGARGVASNPAGVSCTREISAARRKCQQSCARAKSRARESKHHPAQHTGLTGWRSIPRPTGHQPRSHPRLAPQRQLSEPPSGSSDASDGRGGAVPLEVVTPGGSGVRSSSTSTGSSDGQADIDFSEFAIAGPTWMEDPSPIKRRSCLIAEADARAVAFTPPNRATRSSRAAIAAFNGASSGEKGASPATRALAHRRATTRAMAPTRARSSRPRAHSAAPHPRPTRARPPQASRRWSRWALCPRPAASPPPRR